ncbi:unnamed protein product [Schistosoma haematobium]|nr:unnamed protein product [Schistosoma haematobium]
MKVLSDTWKQLIGCKCENICRLEDNCTCLSKSGMSYDMNGLLTNFMNPIFECNSECVCSQSCTNRVVQRYLNDAEFTFESEYHTKTYVTNHPVMGRGLKAACEIQRGELVCVYLGEVIPYKEACLREALQLSCYGRNFIMIMREYSDHHLVSETCVDGNSESWGSVKSKARLINHSCTPNLTHYLLTKLSLKVHNCHMIMLSLCPATKYDYPTRFVYAARTPVEYTCLEYKYSSFRRNRSVSNHFKSMQLSKISWWLLNILLYELALIIGLAE